MCRLFSPRNPFSPPDFPDFDLHLKWWASRPLSPLGAYVVVIQLAYMLSLKGWSERANPDARMIQNLEYGISIIITDDFPTQELTTEHAIRVLYELMINMALRKPGFFSAKGSLSLSQRPLLTMHIYRPEIPTISNSTLKNVTSATSSPHYALSLGSKQTSPLNSSLSADSGEIFDPIDNRFRISYKYDGDNVPVQTLFFAFFNGLVQRAQFNDDAPCTHITAVSANSNFVIHIGGGGDYGTVLQTWHIKRAFYNLFEGIYLRQKRFEDIVFSVHWDGRKVADGFMLKLSTVGWSNGTALTAVE